MSGMRTAGTWVWTNIASSGRWARTLRTARRARSPGADGPVAVARDARRPSVDLVLDRDERGVDVVGQRDQPAQVVGVGDVAEGLFEHEGDVRGVHGSQATEAPSRQSPMVLQALEGLSDRDAIAQLRMSISWKVAAGRSLADEGFHPTVLTLWRNKLRVSDRPQRIFDAVREVIDATNVLAGKTRRALDSTVLDDAVTRQDAIMQLVAQIRRVRRLIPAAKALVLVAHDYDNDPGKPACAWNDRADIDRVVTELVNDAHTILAALDGVELDDVQAEAVGLLALVAGQDVEPGDSDGTWRIAPVTRPDRIVSVHRSRVTPRAQDHLELSRRVQSPHRGRTRHRADHRLRADRRQRR